MSYAQERWSRLQGDEFLQRLSVIFGWFENLDLMVDSIYLNERQVVELATRTDHFDRTVNHVVIAADVNPGTLCGTLWGARVYASPHVPEGHIAVVPAGMQLRTLTREACFCVGWADGVKDG